MGNMGHVLDGRTRGRVGGGSGQTPGSALQEKRCAAACVARHSPSLCTKATKWRLMSSSSPGGAVSPTAAAAWRGCTHGEWHGLTAADHWWLLIARVEAVDHPSEAAAGAVLLVSMQRRRASPACTTHYAAAGYARMHACTRAGGPVQSPPRLVRRLNVWRPLRGLLKVLARLGRPHATRRRQELGQEGALPCTTHGRTASRAGGWVGGGHGGRDS